MPLGLFGDLLFLRLYCEASNYEAAEWVGAEALPQSLVGVFERYLRQTAERVRCRPAHPTLPPGYVEAKLAAFANRLWERSARELDWHEAKALFDGNDREWEHSLLRALEEEGVLARDDRDGLTGRTTSVLFDRLGGYLIAEALVSRVSYRELRAELATADFWGRLVGRAHHPLAEDISASLVGLLPDSSNDDNALGPRFRFPCVRRDCSGAMRTRRTT